MKTTEEINNYVKGRSPENILEWISNKFGGKAVFSSSLGYEDQAITHMIFSRQLNIKIFTLDTGRLFPETYSVLANTINRYKKNITAYYPQTNSLEKLVNEKGPNSFYESVENRKECCFIRKVEPLRRALSGNEVWITGIRSEQSSDRNASTMAEFDESNNILKVHPILTWSFYDVKDYIHKYNIPYNPLHDRGYVSIGCAPCTRSVKAGEDFRSGRWWWEDNTKKECGLHINP